MTKADQVMNWLAEHDLIKWGPLEVKCSLPQGCIYKAMNGKIALPEHHAYFLEKELRHYGFKFKPEKNKKV